MPVFFIPYLGKIKLDYKFTNKSNNKTPSPDPIPNPSSIFLETHPTLSQDKSQLQDHISSLLLLNDFSSAFTLFSQLVDKSIPSNILPSLTFNLALSTVFTKEYIKGRDLLKSSNQQDGSSHLLLVYIEHLLHHEIKSLELFASYQKKFISHSRTNTTLFSHAYTKVLPKDPPKHVRPGRPDSTMKKNEIFKTTDPTLTTSASYGNLVPGKSKIYKPAGKEVEKRLKTRETKKLSIKNSCPGLNQLNIHTGSLPELPIYSYELKSFPEFPQMKSPKELGLSTLTKSSLIKVINYFKKLHNNLDQVFKILSKLKFFQQYSKEICLDLLNCATYQYFEQGEVIFKEGDFADKIFVILQGSVSVQQEYKGLNVYVNSRYDGDTIGEYAIARGTVEISFAKRSATCAAGESLHSLFITADDYSGIMNKSADNESAVIKHLKSFRLFEHIPSIDLAYMANCLHVRVYSFEEVILNAGQVPKGLYLIFNGTVKLVYRKRLMELPPKYFFGQRILLGEYKASPCTVLSNAVETSIILIEPDLFGLIYKPMRDITMSLLTRYQNQDL